MIGAQIAFPVRERRERLEKLWSVTDELVLIGAGQAIPIPGGADQTFEFRVHPDYYWLTGCRDPNGVLAFDPHEGWIEFVHEVTDQERTWEGDRPQREGLPLASLSSWLEARKGRPVAVLGAGLPVLPGRIDGDRIRESELEEKTLIARRPKDQVELRLITEAISATAHAFALAERIVRPGMTERQIQIELEAEMFRRGADRTAYGTIVGSGPHSAVLHFTPGPRVVQSGEYVLIDAGAEYLGYAADVTRTFPADIHFSPRQEELYGIVVTAQRAAIERCRPGVNWRAVHESTARDLAAGLCSLGILSCSVDEAIETEAIALFFPHGVGHMVGLGVRDAATYPGPANARTCCGVRLRVDLALERGFVMTIEPGVYFIPAILNREESRKRFRDQVEWSVVDRWMDLGGVRIEDNVLVTDDEPINLTAVIPK